MGCYNSSHYSDMPCVNAAPICQLLLLKPLVITENLHRMLFTTILHLSKQNTCAVKTILQIIIYVLLAMKQVCVYLLRNCYTAMDCNSLPM